MFATVYGDKKVVIVNYNPFAVELKDGSTVGATSYKVCTLAEYEIVVNGIVEEVPNPELPPVDENNGQEG